MKSWSEDKIKTLIELYKTSSIYQEDEPVFQSRNTKHECSINSVTKQRWKFSLQFFSSVVLYRRQPISHSLLRFCNFVSCSWKSPHDCTAWGLNFLGGKLNWQTNGGDDDFLWHFIGTDRARERSLHDWLWSSHLNVLSLATIESLSALGSVFVHALTEVPRPGLVLWVHSVFSLVMLQCHPDCKVGAQHYLSWTASCKL